MGLESNSIRVAAVQASSVFLNLEESLKKACGLIREAGKAGANVVGFPEGFLPGHPVWYHLHPVSSPTAAAFAKRLFLNSVVIPGAATDALCAAAREASVFVVIGVCEREQHRLGTMYNSLLFIDQRGEIVGRHRKLIPTLGERVVHCSGDALGLKVYPTPFGRISGLICAENDHPLATYTLDALGSNIHVAAWPPFFQPGKSMQEAILFNMRSLAYRMKAFVISAVACVCDDMVEQLPASSEQRELLQQMQQQGGGASVIGPRGEILAGPMPAGEGILYADLSLDDLIVPKIVQDYGGHYNRFDVFRLEVSSGYWPNLHHAEVQRAEAGGGSVGTAGTAGAKPSGEVPPGTFSA